MKNLLLNFLIQIKIIIILSISFNEIALPFIVFITYLIIKLFFELRNKRQIQ